MINKPRQKASKTRTNRISGLVSKIQREIDVALKLDLTAEELENLATDQLEHARPCRRHWTAPKPAGDKPGTAQAQASEA
ncbi:MAG: hypothetical protein HC888_13950 [Candidatus Competibacteraceae bacterium]|nr:hypothetical protein [Candidatus Competibacteraceae bacterium]